MLQDPGGRDLGVAEGRAAGYPVGAMPPELTPALAEHLLEDRPLVPAMAGSIADMKALRDRCLAVGIPALVGCPPGGGKG
jgi:hypothetical protein